MAFEIPVSSFKFFIETEHSLPESFSFGLGKLTEGEGSVQLTSTMQTVLYKKVKNVCNIKTSQSRLISTRRSTVLRLPVQ